MSVKANGLTNGDNVFNQAIYLRLYHREYVKIMKKKFDCIHYNQTLYFKTLKECKEAIEFLESIKLMEKIENFE